MGTQKTQNSQNNFEERTKLEVLYFLISNYYVKATAIQTVWY